MKRALTALGAIVAVALLSVPASHPAGAQSSATVSLMHGIPGTPVDVVVGGAVVVPNFQPGTMQDISKFAGQTLTDVEVRVAGTADVVIGPIGVPGGAVVRQLDDPRPPRRQRQAHDHALRERHRSRARRPRPPHRPPHAPRPPSTSCWPTAAVRSPTSATPTKRPRLSPPAQIAGAKIAPTGGDPIADVPTVELGAGSDLIVYAVGSLDAKTFTFATQTIDDLGGAPNLGQHRRLAANRVQPAHAAGDRRRRDGRGGRRRVGRSPRRELAARRDRATTNVDGPPRRRQLAGRRRRRARRGGGADCRRRRGHLHGAGEGCHSPHHRTDERPGDGGLASPGDHAATVAPPSRGTFAARCAARRGLIGRPGAGHECPESGRGRHRRDRGRRRDRRRRGAARRAARDPRRDRRRLVPARVRPGPRPGATVLAAHVNWHHRDGPFVHLRQLDPGAAVRVTSADGSAGSTRSSSASSTTSRRCRPTDLDPWWTRDARADHLWRAVRRAEIHRYRDNIVVYAVPVA